MTLEMPSCVFAWCARCARCVRAVIYQLARTRGFSRVSRLAGANLHHQTHYRKDRCWKKIFSAKQRNDYLDMFLRCANGVHTTRIVRKTSDSTSMIIANLFLCTVIVNFTFDRLTANLVVFNVSEKARFTRTRRGMIISLAFGVTTAEYHVANSATLRLDWHKNIKKNKRYIFISDRIRR